MKEDKILLKLHYKSACNDYAYELMRRWKKSADVCWWAADEVGGLWCFDAGEHSVNMHEIIYCIDNDVVYDDYLKYQDYCSDCSYVGLRACNLERFLEKKGVYTQEALTQLKSLKKGLDDLLEEAKNGKRFFN